MHAEKPVKLAFKIGSLMGFAAFAAIFMTSVFNAADKGDVVSGLFIGLSVGLLLLCGVASTAVWWLRRQSRVVKQGLGEALAQPLRPVLDELEATRRAVIGKVARRSLWRVPLCIGIGAAIWLASRDSQDPGTLFNLLEFTVAGTAAGYVWASAKLRNNYRRLYKERVLPRLAERYGAITYCAAAAPDMKRFEQEHIFRGFDGVRAEDELAGTYRGLPISIVELTLTAGAGDDKRIVFDGLLVEIGLRRRLAGITAVVTDAGVFGNFRDWLTRSGRQRIRLEDPRFESVYQVWGTDQIVARALLSPAFMERMLTLAERPGFNPPLVLAHDNTLTVTMPKVGRNDLFEPPSYLRPAASGEALAQLDGDIAAVLATADTVIDFDPVTSDVASRSNG